MNNYAVWVWSDIAVKMALATLYFVVLTFLGIGIVRLVSKVRVDITLDDHDLEMLGAGEEVVVITNSVHTTLRYRYKDQL